MPDANSLRALVALLAPGLLIIWIRDWFSAAAKSDFQDRALQYAGVSAIYYAVTNPVLSLLPRHLVSELEVVNLFEYVLLPSTIGFVVAWWSYNEKSTWIWRKLKMRPVHSAPTAWDFAFLKRQGAYITITLKDNRQVHGVYGKDSFASSRSGERDVLLTRVCTVQDGKWAYATPPTAMLVCDKDIRSVEFHQGGSSD